MSWPVNPNSAAGRRQTRCILFVLSTVRPFTCSSACVSSPLNSRAHSPSAGGGRAGDSANPDARSTRPHPLLTAERIGNQAVRQADRCGCIPAPPPFARPQRNLERSSLQRARFRPCPDRWNSLFDIPPSRIAAIHDRSRTSRFLRQPGAVRLAASMASSSCRQCRLFPWVRLQWQSSTPWSTSSYALLTRPKSVEADARPRICFYHWRTADVIQAESALHRNSHSVEASSNEQTAFTDNPWSTSSSDHHRGRRHRRQCTPSSTC